ncbi:VanZ family protein [Nitrospira sp. M1]
MKEIGKKPEVKRPPGNTTVPQNIVMTTQPSTPQDQRTVAFICYWLPLFVYAGAIVFISSLSMPKMHFETFAQTYLSVSVSFFTKMNDKIVHLIEYTILGLLTYRAIRFSWGRQLGPFAAFLTVIVVALFGCTDEFHQWFIPLRSTEVLDLLADIVGSVVGIACWEWGRTLPAIRLLEEQLPFKLQLIKSLAASKF